MTLIRIYCFRSCHLVHNCLLPLYRVYRDTDVPLLQHCPHTERRFRECLVSAVLAVDLLRVAHILGTNSGIDRVLPLAYGGSRSRGRPTSSSGRSLASSLSVRHTTTSHNTNPSATPHGRDMDTD